MVVDVLIVETGDVHIAKVTKVVIMAINKTTLGRSRVQMHLVATYSICYQLFFIHQFVHCTLITCLIIFRQVIFRSFIFHLLIL